MPTRLHLGMLTPLLSTEMKHTILEFVDVTLVGENVL